MRDIEKTICSQYGNSTTLVKLICNMNEYIDPSADIDNFYNVVWNVDTAIGFGLDIWGEIVGVSREIFTDPVTYLDDDAFRSLILLKALSNISIDSAPSINQLLQNWLGGGVRAYVQDLGGMALLYVFEFLLTDVQIQIITGSTIFLRGAGVQANILTEEFPVIGFAEMGQPWVTTMGNGVFSEGVI
jgi:hypothetical protein